MWTNVQQEEDKRVKEKDMYTLKELYDNLDITMTDFSRRAGLTEGTLARIRKGYSARRSTVNKLLKTFSKVYELDFSLDNVIGIYPLNSSFDESLIESDVSTVTAYGSSQTQSPQKQLSRRKKESELAEGNILARHFAIKHGVKPETFRDHYMKGFGAKTGEKDKADVSSRPKPGREKESEWFLTPEQQKKVLDFWNRHGVTYQAPEDEQEEQRKENHQ